MPCFKYAFTIYSFIIHQCFSFNVQKVVILGTINTTRPLRQLRGSIYRSPKLASFCANSRMVLKTYRSEKPREKKKTREVI